MQDHNMLTAIDVGTSKVCTIMARTNGNGSFEVVAHSIVASEGLRKGNVADIAAAEKAIRSSLEGVERKSALKVRSGYVGVTGAHVAFENRWDVLGWAGQHGVITADDLTRVPATVASSSAQSGRDVLHAIPIAYSLDGQKGIRNPVGMHTRQLEVESHIVTGASSFIGKLVAAVEGAGVEVEDLVLEPLASSEAVVTAEERERGVALVDIGGGTTDLVIFKNGRMFYTSVIPVGGYHFTNDICMTYDTTYPAAEDVKLKYAHTELHGIHPNEEVTLPVVGGTAEQKVLRRDICQLTRERAQELARLIRLRIKEAKMDDASNLGLILTGGTSNLPGLEALVRRSLSNSVRIGVPNGNGPSSLPQELKAPAYATSVGILLWAMKQGNIPTTHTTRVRPTRGDSGLTHIISQLFRQTREMLPLHLFSLKKWRT